MKVGLWHISLGHQLLPTLERHVARAVDGSLFTFCLLVAFVLTLQIPTAGRGFGVNPIDLSRYSVSADTSVRLRMPHTSRITSARSVVGR